MTQLYGLDGAMRRIRFLVDRSEWHGGRTPIVVFVGPPGIGKTALLKGLEDRLNGNIPHAPFNFAAEPAKYLDEVFAALAFALNDKYKMYGRLAFPRLAVGRLAIEQGKQGKQGISLDGPTARAKLKAALAESRHIPTVRKVLDDAVQELLSTVRILSVIPGLRLVLKKLPGLVIAVLTLTRPGRRIIFGSGQVWYRSLGNDPIHALVALAHKGHTREEQGSKPEEDRSPEENLSFEENVRAIDELLMAAFLADLRAAYRGWWHALHRPLNCVVLLDNVNSRLGVRFLEQLAATRQRHEGEDADPMTVVATSPRGLPGRLAERAGAVVDIDVKEFPDHPARNTAPSRLQVGLRALTISDIEKMVPANKKHSEDIDRITWVVHRFTDGHPRSARILMDAIATRHQFGGLRCVLDDRVRDELRNGLLGDFPRGSLPALVTCAAARDQAEISLIIAHSEQARQTELTELYRLGLRLPDKGDLLHPALRRLLLSDLSNRPNSDQASWTAVHDLLRDQAATEDARLYHSLAIDEEGVHATRTLTDQLPQTNAKEWVARLKDITQAPLRSPVPDPPSREMQRRAAWATAEDSPTAKIALLISGLRIVADPLTSFQRQQVHRAIADQYTLIARRSTDMAVLIHEAERHRVLAEQWIPEAGR